MRKQVLTPEQIELAKKLREHDGKPLSEIADILGVNVSNIKRLSWKQKWKNAKATEVKDDKKIKEVKDEKIRKAEAILSEDNINFAKKISELMNDENEPVGIIKIVMGPLLKRLFELTSRSGNVKEISNAIMLGNTILNSEAYQSKEELRMLTVYAPEETEIYEDPPEALNGTTH